MEKGYCCFASKHLFIFCTRTPVERSYLNGTPKASTSPTMQRSGSGRKNGKSGRSGTSGSERKKRRRRLKREKAKQKRRQKAAKEKVEAARYVRFLSFLADNVLFSFFF